MSKLNKFQKKFLKTIDSVKTKKQIKKQFKISNKDEDIVENPTIRKGFLFKGEMFNTFDEAMDRKRECFNK